MTNPAKTVEIAPGIRWVGVEDWHSRVFKRSYLSLRYLL
jgi:hypothetical protein